LSFIESHPFGNPCTDIVFTNEIIGAGRGVGIYVGTSVVGTQEGTAEVGLTVEVYTGKLFGARVGEEEEGFKDGNLVETRVEAMVGDC